MATDCHELGPSELCRVLNSTPLGEVIDTRLLQRHRNLAGVRIGNGRKVDILRYVAWLVQLRHLPKSERPAPPPGDLGEAALGAARRACSQGRLKGHGQKFTRKHEEVLAALLTEPSHAKAAAKAGVSESTLYRWLEMPEFNAAFRQARRSLVEASMGRLQAATGPAVDSLVDVARNGKRDSDRTRASIALLQLALDDVDGVPPMGEKEDARKLGAADVVKILSDRLLEIEQSELSPGEKARLTAALTDALLRAIHVDTLNERLEALENVLSTRKENDR